MYIRSHKSFETELVFTIVNKGGTIEFHVYDESNKEILSLVNPESGTYNVSLETGKKYLGSDGTEVGMYGGSLPFDPTPTNPQITKCTVSPKSTADGKLSVEIEVSSAK